MTIGGRHDWKSALVIVLCLSAATESIILAVAAFRWSLADVYATQVGHHLDTLNSDLSNKNAEQWRMAKQHLARALELRPADARYFDLAESFYQNVDALETSKNAFILQELKWRGSERKALKYARRALRLAPSNSYLWGRMMVSKLGLLQFDDELTGTIERSVKLGPWVRSTQYRTAIAGLYYWPFLQDAARPHILEAIEHVLIMNDMAPNGLYDISRITSHENFIHICEQQLQDVTRPHLLKYCS